MQVVAIGSWQKETPELVQGLADVLGITAYEARQRLIGNGPAVVAAPAQAEFAMSLGDELHRLGFAPVIVDTGAVEENDRIVVRRFKFRNQALLIESSQRRLTEISYAEAAVLLVLSSVSESSTTTTITERKFSLGKTLATGGVPMFSKKVHQEKQTDEERDKHIYLYAPGRPTLAFSQSGMAYDGLGDAMQPSRELNFTHLQNELRRLCPAATFDDRLLNRMALVRLLGPTLNPESNLDLAAEILARSLRPEIFG